MDKFSIMIKRSPANKSQALKQENFEEVKKGIKTKPAKEGFFADHISCKF